MNSASTDRLLKCPNCGATNRISSEMTASREPICGRCKTPLSTAKSPFIFTDANFNETIKTSKLPILVDFWAAWCGSCRMIAPMIETLAVELAGQAIIGKMDIDSNQITAERYAVRSIPTLIIFKDGREVNRMVGVGSKEGILHKLRPFLSE